MQLINLDLAVDYSQPFHRKQFIATARGLISVTSQLSIVQETAVFCIDLPEFTNNYIIFLN